MTTTEETRIVKPWEGSGVEIEDVSRAYDLMEGAGLNWSVEGRPMFIPSGGPDDTVNFFKSEKDKAIVRLTDNAHLGTVGVNWNILQNYEVFDFVDDMSSMGLVKYHSAGNFKDGRIIWVQAEFQESEILPGDVHKKFLMLTNAFDGTFSVRIGWTDVRVACYNTFLMAAKEAGKAYSIRHTASMRDKIGGARKALVAAESEARKIDMFQKALTRLRMTGDMWKSFGETLIPDPEEGKSKSRAENARNRLLMLAVTGRGQDIPGVQGTGYAAMNALTEYVNYERTTRGSNALEKQASRFQATLFGSGNRMINDGISVLNGFLVDHGIQVETVV